MRTIDGLTAYDILRLPECKIILPKARSMTQARIDYESMEPQIFEWYQNNKEMLIASHPELTPNTINTK